jgi:hypothetical protein
MFRPCSFSMFLCFFLFFVFFTSCTILILIIIIIERWKCRHPLNGWQVFLLLTSRRFRVIQLCDLSRISYSCVGVPYFSALARRDPSSRGTTFGAKKQGTPGYHMMKTASYLVCTRFGTGKWQTDRDKQTNWSAIVLTRSTLLWRADRVKTIQASTIADCNLNVHKWRTELTTATTCKC